MEKIRRYIISMTAMLAVAFSFCSCSDDKDMPDASDIKKNLPGVWKFEGNVDNYGQTTIFVKFGEFYAVRGEFQYFQAFHKAEGYEYYDFTKTGYNGGSWVVSDVGETIWSHGPYKMVEHVATVIHDNPSENNYGSLGFDFFIQSIGSKRMEASIVMMYTTSLTLSTFRDLEIKKSSEKEMNQFREQVIATGKDINPLIELKGR